MKILKKVKVYGRAVRVLYKNMTLHSRIVFLLKIALPSCIALFLGLIIVIPHIDDKVKNIKISMPTLESTDKISFNMDGADFYGQGDDDTLFSVNVENFKEDKEKEVMYFSKIKSKIFLKDGSWIDILTDGGNYKKSKDLFSMRGNIFLLDNEDNKLYTEKADVNLKDMSVSGDEKIRAVTNFGEIESDGFYFKKNDVYHFLGKVRGNIDTSKIKKSK
ncbi:MAG: LPS export ABC transporter periplasmic protein LptC [bacterium]|nr:LPS export ABC transporter periplasmic protein LptC [bacterium]